MAYGSWKPYVPVAQRRARMRREMDKLRKKGVAVHPIEIEGRKITRTFWGTAWCDHLEHFSDYANRLPRGKTYVRNGSVCHLEIDKGLVKAIVSGSELYHIKIDIKPLSKTAWQQIQSHCTGHIGSLLELLQGKLSDAVMAVVTDPNTGLFPQPKEIHMACDCPDWADMCKHLAAVLYGVGALLDQAPALLFKLRGVNHEDLVSGPLQISQTSGTRRRLDENLGAVFGVALEESADLQPRPKQKPSAATASSLTTESRHSKPSAAKTSVSKTPASKSSKTTVSRSKTAAADPKATAKNAVFKPTSTHIRRLRKRFEMNKSQFAELVGVSVSTLTQWEEKDGRALLKLKRASHDALITAAQLDKDVAWRQLQSLRTDIGSKTLCE